MEGCVNPFDVPEDRGAVEMDRNPFDRLLKDVEVRKPKHKWVKQRPPPPPLPPRPVGYESTAARHVEYGGGAKSRTNQLAEIDGEEVEDSENNDKAFFVAVKEEEEYKEQQLQEEEEEEDYSCPICFEDFCTIFPRTIHSCPVCHKSFCTPCITEALERTGQSCPMCRNSCEPVRNEDLENLLGQQPCDCRYCGDSILTAEMNVHETTCRQTYGRLETVTRSRASRPGSRSSDFTEYWECRRCTFHNEMEMSVCSMCHASLVEHGAVRRRELETREEDEEEHVDEEEQVQQAQHVHQQQHEHDDDNIPMAQIVVDPSATMPAVFQKVLLCRTRSKQFFRKWKPCLVTLTHHGWLYLHDPSYGYLGEATNRNAFKKVLLHPYMSIEKVKEKIDVIVQKSNHKRQVSPRTRIVRSRLFENPLTHVSRDRELMQNKRFSSRSQRVGVNMIAELGVPVQDRGLLIQLLDAVHVTIVNRQRS